MKAFASLVVICSLIVYVSGQQGLTCRQYCPRVTCESVQTGMERCSQKQLSIPGSKFEYRAKASFCGCCHECVRFLQEGDQCARIPADQDRTSRCDWNLKCDYDHTYKCIKDYN